MPGRSRMVDSMRLGRRARSCNRPRERSSCSTPRMEQSCSSLGKRKKTGNEVARRWASPTRARFGRDSQATGGPASRVGLRWCPRDWECFPRCSEVLAALPSRYAPSPALRGAGSGRRLRLGRRSYACKRHSESGATAVALELVNFDGGYFAFIGTNARGTCRKSKSLRTFARQSV